MTVAIIFVLFAKSYLGIGFVFAIWFAARGAARLDPVAAHGTIGFRALIVPGATLLWPYLLWRASRGPEGAREEINAHRVAAKSPRPSELVQ